MGKNDSLPFGKQLSLVATAGAAVGAAAGMYLGASAATSVAVATVATAGAYTVAAGIAVCGISDAGEVLTGTNFVRDNWVGGNQKLYDTTKLGLSFVGMGTVSTGSYYNSQTNYNNLRRQQTDSSACFVKETMVLASTGYVTIETIKSGDMVWASNPETGETDLKRVLQTFINETDELVHVFVNGDEIITTPEHPFYVSQIGWVDYLMYTAN